MTDSGGWRIPVIFAVACVGVRLAAYLATGYQVDDALITFRYAENLAAGNGFVYNLGERVLGTTSPFFTLVLALFKTLGLSVPITAIALSLAASAATAVTLVRLGEKAGLAQYGLLPAALYVLYPRCLICDISGLETALFTFLLVMTVHDLFSREYLTASVTAAFAAITRPEGFGLALIVAVVAAVESPATRWRLLGAPILIVGSWLVFSVVYFGSILPNSILAKAALYESAGNSLLSRLSAMMTMGLPFGGLALLAVCAILVWMILRRDRIALITLIAVGFILALALFSPRIFFWYPAPVLPLVFIALARLWHEVSGHQKWHHAPLIVMIASMLVLAPLSSIHVGRLRAEMQWYRTTHIAAAEYLNMHAQSADKVLAEDIGYFGYRYRGEIIDRDGLVTPQAVDYNRRGAYSEFVDSVKADWIFLAVDFPAAKTILVSPAFAEKYKDVIFATAGIKLTHRLFERR